MIITPKFLLTIVLIFSVTIINSTFAEKSSEQKMLLSKQDLDEAFISAVKYSDLKKIRELLEAGADVNTLIPHTYTAGDCDWEIKSSPLMFAIKCNRPEIVKILVQVKNKLSTSLNEALINAIEEGCLEIVEELIKAGADVNYINNNFKDSPLILAVGNARPISEFSRQAQEQMKSRWYERKKIIEILLKAGAHINHVNKDGKTALMKAIEQHDLNTVKDLLKFPEMTSGSFFGFGKKPINYANENGDTALIIAIKNIRTSYIVGNSQQYNICVNSQKIVEALLEVPGIDIDHANKKGESARVLLERVRS